MHKKIPLLSNAEKHGGQPIGYAFKIYTIVLALQGAFAQLPGAVNYVVYYSGFLLGLGLMAMCTKFYKVNLFERQNWYILFLGLIVCLGIIRSFDPFLSFRSGVRFLSSFMPFVLLMIVIRDRNMFVYYLRTNVYVLGISVILLSTFMVFILPDEGAFLETHRGMERITAGFVGWHSFGHFCLLTIFLLSLYLLYSNDRKEKYFLYIIYIIGCYMCFKSGCRTVYLGLFIFLLVWFTLKKKFLWLLLLLICVPLFYSFHENFRSLFSEEIGTDRANYEKMGSGRIGVWERSVEFYMAQPLELKIIGAGPDVMSVGWEKMYNVKPHNDYLSILFQYGLIGLLIFLVFYADFLIKSLRLFRSDIGILYIAMLISIAGMNFVSNSYIARVGIATIFWPVLIPLVNKDLLPVNRRYRQQ